MFSRLNGGMGREPAGMAIWGVLSWSYKRRHKERNQTPQFGPKSWPWASCMAPSPVVNESQAWAPGGTCSCLSSSVPSGSKDGQGDILWGLSFPGCTTRVPQWFSKGPHSSDALIGCSSKHDLVGQLVLRSCSLTSQTVLFSKMVMIVSTS